MNSFAAWLESTFMYQLMVDIYWMFPLMETIHFIGLVLLFGALLVVDGRKLRRILRYDTDASRDGLC